MCSVSNSVEETTMNKLLAFLREEEGLTVVEYAIAGGLVGAAVIAAFRALGLTVAGVIGGINTQLTTP
jgi:pilus assembly protein Flp/PilA